MKIKFWGVRGSTPTPERRNSRYGGNTPCIEVRLANGTIIILDCGSGIRGLGKHLLREFGERPIHAFVLLTHFHWDHIQGIPFFTPLYKKGNAFLFHSAQKKGPDLEAAILGQMADPFFPVDMRVMGASRHFYQLDDRPIDLNGAIITSAPLNHPQGCVAYRIEADGGVFVLATDTEPGSPLHDRSVRDIAKGADALVYDAQYTPEQLAGEKKGWGHSTWLEGTRIALESGVKRLILFHHDPDNDDLFVDGLVEKARQEFPFVTGASETLELDLPAGEDAHASLANGSDRRQERRYHVELPVRLGWRGPDGERVEEEGVAQDLSRTGIFFIAPTDVIPGQPVEVEIILPDEITHRGDVGFRFIAHPVRSERSNGAQSRGYSVGARLEIPGDSVPDEAELPLK